MRSILKKNNKLIIISQFILFAVAILYILESIFVRGLFTNVYLLFATIIVEIIAIALSIIKKEYKFVIIDILICLGCVMIFGYLINM